MGCVKSLSERLSLGIRDLHQRCDEVYPQPNASFGWNVEVLLFRFLDWILLASSLIKMIELHILKAEIECLEFNYASMLCKFKFLSQYNFPLVEGFNAF